MASDPEIKRFVIGITGGSGSGKTTFINNMRERFTEEEVCIVSQDDYYKPRTDQEQDAQGYNVCILFEWLDVFLIRW